MNNELLKQVIDTGQDFEFYPTTDEIIGVLCRNTDEHSSILDIGAGHGKVLGKFKGDKYAIEKSRLLLDSLPSDVIIVGVDFDTNTLIDKSVDIIFCNPPYSQYEKWAERIIKEANADKIFLVIPVRWSKSNAIITAIKDRSASSKVMGKFSFESSEDRKARATVELVQIDLGDRHKYNYMAPFDLFFKEAFGDIDPKKHDEYDFARERNKEIKHELVESGDLITTLLNLYNADLKKIESNYIAITSLDASVLGDFNIDLESLVKGLKLRMKGLKNIYWEALFERFSKVTSRLTSFARSAFLDRIFRNTSIDFTRENIHAVADWVIRNANLSFEDQILEFYERMLGKVNCQAYKSNSKVFEDQNWGWDEKEIIKENEIFVKLSYIIIIQSGTGAYGQDMKLSAKSTDYFYDLSVIAKQLDFRVSDELMGENNTELRLSDFYNCYPERAVKYVTFFEKNNVTYELYTVKFFKNGNIHIKFNRNFMNKLNVIYGKLKGWISNPQDAKNEMDIDIKEAVEHFNYDLPKIGSDLLMLDNK